MGTPLNSIPPTRTLLRISDVVDELSLSRTKVYELMSSGLLNSVRIGSSRRIRRSDLDLFVNSLSADEWGLESLYTA
ncbi:MAG: helix-turn-helix domain-containing protein [Armatimonadetes bacterium]|nr:helix-turn-helix domain-containing protein [Armatimonadota bacterium]